MNFQKKVKIWEKLKIRKKIKIWKKTQNLKKKLKFEKIENFEKKWNFLKIEKFEFFFANFDFFFEIIEILKNWEVFSIFWCTILKKILKHISPFFSKFFNKFWSKIIEDFLHNFQNIEKAGKEAGKKREKAGDYRPSTTLPGFRVMFTLRHACAHDNVTTRDMDPIYL